MKKALCLQGGGAKGAFQAGALKALTERGYHFDCVVGASVGALNAALYALGQTDKMYSLWEQSDYSELFPEEIRLFGENMTGLSFLLAALRVVGSGIDTARLRELVRKNVDEDALRASPIRFGLVTVRDGETRTLCKKFIEDIPKGRVVDYLMASMALPFFKQVEIDGVRYLDGGMLDNLPIGMLAEAGYKDITAIRLGGDIRYASEDPDLKIRYIDPSDRPGSTMGFKNAEVRRGLYLGYYDMQRELDGLLGERYYLQPFGRADIHRMLKEHPAFLSEALAFFGEKPKGSVREDARTLASRLSAVFDKEGASEAKTWTFVTEWLATTFHLPRWHVYRFDEILSETAKVFDKNDPAAESEIGSKLFPVANMLFKELKNG